MPGLEPRRLRLGGTVRFEEIDRLGLAALFEMREKARRSGDAAAVSACIHVIARRSLEDRKT